MNIMAEADGHSVSDAMLKQIQYEREEADEIVGHALRGRAVDKEHVFTLNRLLKAFMADGSQQHLEIPGPFSSFHRKIAHKVAAYHRLEHNVDPISQAFIFTKTRHSQPSLRLDELIQEHDKVHEEFHAKHQRQGVKLMKRPGKLAKPSEKVASRPTEIKEPTYEHEQGHDASHTKHKGDEQVPEGHTSPPGTESDAASSQTTLSAREEAYQKARARIFGDFVPPPDVVETKETIVDGRTIRVTKNSGPLPTTETPPQPARNVQSAVADDDPSVYTRWVGFNFAGNGNTPWTPPSESDGKQGGQMDPQMHFPPMPAHFMEAFQQMYVSGAMGQMHGAPHGGHWPTSYPPTGMPWRGPMMQPHTTMTPPHGGATQHHAHPGAFVQPDHGGMPHRGDQHLTPHPHPPVPNTRGALPPHSNAMPMPPFGHPSFGYHPQPHHWHPQHPGPQQVASAMKHHPPHLPDISQHHGHHSHHQPKHQPKHQ
eukprot:m.9660 g.9660  ORF g.9660 m.9660 type:complete len:482 (+) comp5480_c0_seq1:260-1705(+)